MLFLYNFESSSEVVKIISADVKIDVKQQEIKELVAIFQLFIRNTFSKLEIPCKTDVYFSFNFAWWYIPSNLLHIFILPVKNRGLVGFTLSRQNLLSVMEIIRQQSVILIKNFNFFALW